MEKNNDIEKEILDQTIDQNECAETVETDVETPAEEQEPETVETVIEKLQAQLAEQKKEYLFLMAEFDNFRKRTIKEKAELIKNGTEGAVKNLLPVIDDFERGISAAADSDDSVAIKEGIVLIYSKFIKYLEQNGVKEIQSTDQTFNTEYHEAITTFPASDESMKGKIIDTVQKGYTINDKVLRHAKVVVGQ
ncbi:MAG: nucleotide exchange factor GrpE [Bacteroidales bacterium]